MNINNNEIDKALNNIKSLYTDYDQSVIDMNPDCQLLAYIDQLEEELANKIMEDLV